MSQFTPQRSDAIRRELLLEARRAGRSRRSPAVACALVASGLLLGSTATAAAMSVMGQGVPSESSTRSPSFGKLSGDLFAAMAMRPGFVSGELTDHGAGMTFVWSGPPDAVTVGLVEEAVGGGLDVRIVQAVHPPQRFSAAASALVSALEAVDIHVSRFGPDRTFAAIEIAGPKLSTDAALQRRAVEIAREVIGDQYEVRVIPYDGDPVMFSAPAREDEGAEN